MSRRYDLYAFASFCLSIFFLIVSIVQKTSQELYMYVFLCLLFLMCFLCTYLKGQLIWHALQEKLFVDGLILTQEDKKQLKCITIKKSMQSFRLQTQALCLYAEGEEEAALQVMAVAWQKVRRFHRLKKLRKQKGHVHAQYMLLLFLSQKELLQETVDECYDLQDQLVIRLIEQLSLGTKGRIDLDQLFLCDALLEQVDAIYYRQYLAFLLAKTRASIQFDRAREEMQRLHRVTCFPSLQQQTAACLHKWQKEEEQ